MKATIGPQQQIDEQNKSRCHRRVGRVAGAGQNPDGGRAPDGGGGIEPAHARAFAENQAGAEKADSGHHLGGDPGRARPPGTSASKITKLAEPKATNVLVRRPATRLRHCRSNPIRG